jgi:ferritin
MKRSIIKQSDLTIIEEACLQELTASNMYRNLSIQCLGLGYFGASKFFDNESTDKLKHYNLHAEFLNNRGKNASVPTINAQTKKVTSLEQALTIAYKAECQLGELYNNWYSQLEVPTMIHLQQFVEIQVKAIGEYGDWLARLSLVSDDSYGILLIDKEMGEV